MRWGLWRRRTAERANERDQGASEAAATGARWPVPIEITDTLDLHTFAPREVPEVVETYLEEARARGFRVVRVIHGKGIGVQRERVRSVLQRTPFVARYEDAPVEAGSWGATVVWLHAEERGSGR